jgi:putative endonuclease
MIWYVYVLQSVTGRLYTGISPDPVSRLAKHNAGKGAKATRAGRPWRIVHQETLGTKGDALRREAAIKRLSRAEKLRLVKAG